MIRSRLAAVLLLLVALVAATAYAGTLEQFNFGPTELGQLKTACARVTGPFTANSITVSPPYFVRGIRVGQLSDGEQVCSNTPGLTTPVTLPEPINASQQLVFDVDLIPTEIGPADRIVSINGQPAFELLAMINAVAGCVDSSTANCLQDNRFKTRVHWRTDFGTRGAGPVVPVSSNDSGLFYFFNPNNWEMLLKVLDGCPINNRYWVFAAATTNVEFTITVTDTQEDVVSAYFKPRGQAAPAITDTEAFATCP